MFRNKNINNMSVELLNRELNKEEFLIDDLVTKKDFVKFKIRENIFKIIGGIFSLIVLGLLLVLFYKEIIKRPSKDQKEQIRENINLPNDPRFKKNYKVFPFSLKIYENGVIDIERSSLENTCPSKLLFVKEDSYQLNKIELDKESRSSNSENFELALAGDLNFIFHCDMKYKSKVEESKKESIKTSYLAVKKKISSLSVKRNDTIINNAFKQKIEDIANDELYSDEEKALLLDELFNEYGYFVPLKITIGGTFYQEISKIEDENIINNIKQLEANINITISKFNLNSSVEYNKLYENLFKNLYSNEKIHIIGGDTSKKTFEEWEAS